MRTSIDAVLSALGGSSAQADARSQGAPTTAARVDLDRLDKLAAAVDYSLGHLDELALDTAAAVVAAPAVPVQDRVRRVLQEKTAARQHEGDQTLVHSVLRKLADRQVQPASHDEALNEASTADAGTAVFGTQEETSDPEHGEPTGAAEDTTMSLSDLLRSSLGVGGLDDSPLGTAAAPAAQSAGAETGDVRGNNRQATGDVRQQLISKLRQRLRAGA